VHDSWIISPSIFMHVLIKFISVIAKSVLVCGDIWDVWGEILVLLSCVDILVGIFHFHVLVRAVVQMSLGFCLVVSWRRLMNLARSDCLWYYSKCVIWSTWTVTPAHHFASCLNWRFLLVFLMFLQPFYRFHFFLRSMWASLRLHDFNLTDTPL
jgi:hypothetical protein